MDESASGGNQKAHHAPDGHGDPGVGIEGAGSGAAADETIDQKADGRAAGGAEDGFEERSQGGGLSGDRGQETRDRRGEAGKQETEENRKEKPSFAIL